MKLGDPWGPSPYAGVGGSPSSPPPPIPQSTGNRLGPAQGPD